MKKSDETLRNLIKLRIELQASVNAEKALRKHWRKSKPDDLDYKLMRSLNYQRFLESLIEEVFE